MECNDDTATYLHSSWYGVQGAEIKASHVINSSITTLSRPAGGNWLGPQSPWRLCR
ncbi:hypothetical protein ASPCADRAFT_210224 [Aspergillus carbonarius ITEM 5010]|uniref:Uncharacterized protein n=1 Tax=Aspergillus carbonarius (strain ITEM 5010) TaxID=602072 RepID=A0A1R3RCZ2_ASPC5|nr:hypothetical protein ASPCADRAFT_210224 [Aspergillus carbonarius ITEM 5010]